MSSPIRVLLVDDDPLVRSALRMMIDGTDDVRVVGEASDGSELLSAVAAHRPDVVLLDIRMPQIDGLTAVERLHGAPPSGGAAGGAQVIMLTTLNAEDQVLRALRAGAGGFLLKDSPPAEIVRAIRLVAAGEAMLSPAVTRQLIAHVAEPRPDDRVACASLAIAALSEREREVAIAVGQGKPNAEIASELHMSVATVKAHVSHVLQKLDLTNRVQIALLVHDAGLT
ncbi:MAG: response regulator transcription factor [Patulibacter sp.]|nr:response regulator transcription factor [Patulibacter sp.]